MNEQIYNLSLLADQYAHSICDGNEHADWYQTRDQKFAELIIAECVEAARTVGGSAGVEMETIIRNRFGVE